MEKHMTKLLATLLAAIMLLPATVQAAPADGWTDEAEQAYKTVTELVVQRVTESKDYLAAATQEENAKAVYALWISGADVPEGFYNEYLQALADWLDLAVKRGKTAYIPGVIRTVAAMGLDVTDFAGHDLMDALRKPELVEADEDRLDMLIDLDAAGDVGKTDEFNALREQLLTEALARQQSSGEFRYTSKWPAELKQKGVDDEPDRFDYILLTAKSVQALAPYQSRKDVSAAIDKALNYLSEQQLPSGGFVKYGDEDVEEDAAVLEMLAALGISLADERFTKDDRTVLDGMMGWYQSTYAEQARTPGQGFYRELIGWSYSTGKYFPVGWAITSWRTMDDPDDPDEHVKERIYINETAFPGLAQLRVMLQAAPVVGGSITAPSGGIGGVSAELDYKQLITEKSGELAEELSVKKLIEEYSYLLDGGSHYITSSQISTFSSQLLAREKMNIKMTEEEQAKLREIMAVIVGAGGETYLGRASYTYAAGAVRAMQYLGMDPGDINGLDYIVPLTNTSKAAPTSTQNFNSYLYDIASIDPEVWRSRGVDGDMLAEQFITRVLADQTLDGGFDDFYGYSVATAKEGQTVIGQGSVPETISALSALALYRDKENVAAAIEAGLTYLSSVQLADGSFECWGDTPNGAVTLSMLSLMDKLDISIDDERFVKNGNTVADAMRTFYVDGVGFISDFEVDAPLDDLIRENSVMGNSSTVSALTYLQAAENGTFGPDGKGSSVFEVVGAALTETPLGAILLAVIVAGILAFAMVRRYRRIKREQ
ncbi:hypothetical protein [Dysosmobacter sp.]|uniref:hypothetical protein n=1 Tax=Dysosmobacter sp. TaxID=2591382 RepID=UPI002F95F640